MVDTSDLGSDAEGCESSSLSEGTKNIEIYLFSKNKIINLVEYKFKLLSYENTIFYSILYFFV